MPSKWNWIKPIDGFNGKRLWFTSPFGPHWLVFLLKGPRLVPVTRTAHCGWSRYKWNWRGQCVGVFSTRDFDKDPISGPGRTHKDCKAKVDDGGLPTHCAKCSEAFQPGDVIMLCDEAPEDAGWHADCFEDTPCGRDEHGEGCPTSVFHA